MYAKEMMKCHLLYSQKHKIKKIMNNHQGKRHESAVKMEDRQMRFADIFVSTRHIIISELNCKRPTVTSQ